MTAEHAGGTTVAPEIEPAAILAERLEEGDAAGAIALAHELHPAELANAFAGIDNEVRELLVEKLAPEEVGATLAYLEPHYRDGLLIGLEPSRIAEILGRVADDVATDVVQELPEEVRRRVLEAVPLRQQHAIDVLPAARRGQRRRADDRAADRDAPRPARRGGDRRAALAPPRYRAAVSTST